MNFSKKQFTVAVFLVICSILASFFLGYVTGRFESAELRKTPFKIVPDVKSSTRAE